MSPVTPSGVRVQTSPLAGVQGAARPASRSGDDFARALRQETVDRPAARPREMARPEREAYRPADRPTDRPTPRPVVRDTTEASRSARADARRVDDRRAVAAGPTDRRDGVDLDASDRAGEPGSTASTAAQQATGSPVTQPTAQAPSEAGLPGSDLLGAALSAGDPGTGVALLGSGADAAEMLVRGAAAVPLDAAASTTAAGATTAAATGGAAIVTDAASLLATGAAGTTTLPGAPGAGSAAIGTGALGSGALTSAQTPATSALATAAAATAAQAATSDVPAAGAPAAASALLATSAPITPTALPSPATGPAVPVEAAVLVPGALGSGSSATGGGATGGGAGGFGSGAATTEGMAQVVAPAPGAGLGGAFAQTLTGVGGAAATTAPSAAGPTAQASFAEQVRGPVLALRTAAPGEHMLTLKVTPDNLGPVQVRAHIGPDGIRIELVGATDAAREGLRNLLTDLRRDLAGTGMNASLSLGTDSGPGGRSGQGAPGDLGSTGDGSAQARPGRTAAAAREVTTPDLPPVPARPTSSGAHGVDILT